MVMFTHTAPDPDDVVISGIGGTFPQSDNVEEFGDNLLCNTNLVEKIINPNWQNDKLGVPHKRGEMRDKNKFDSAFFGISSAQAVRMDPMTRKVLENTFEALLDSGLNPTDLKNTNTAVIFGSFISESEALWLWRGDTEAGFTIVGHSRSMFANRVSHWLNLKGPSYTYLAEEIAGIKGLEMAQKLIKTRQCDGVIVGTVEFTPRSETFSNYVGLGCLSRDGKCRSFDAKGTGYAKSEACVVMHLQRAENAKRIYATLVHAETSFYGDRNAGFVRPVGDSMAQLLESFYETCGVDPTEVSFLEASGCGLKMYEEAEFEAVSKVLLNKRKSPLLVGSVKSNIGHTGAASSSCSIAKCLIAMERGVIPANLHYQTPGPHIPALADGRLKVVTENTKWSPGLVAVNSVELTGAYGHVLLRPYTRSKSACCEISVSLPRLICLSGRNEERIKKILEKVNSISSDNEYVRLVQDVYSSNITHHNYRSYVLSSPNVDVTETQHFDGSKRPVWFVFSGMGSQWPGMATDLMKLPVISHTLRQCHNILQHKGVDLMDILTRDDPAVFDNILHSFVGIAAVQLALVETLRLLNIEPDGMIGHSVGELGCAYADGCFTMEQMILAAYYRGLASLEAELINGRMAAVGLGYKKVKDLITPSINVACHNSDESCTISGPAEDVTQFVDKLKKQFIFAREVNVSNIAYHSQYIKPAAPKLLAYLKNVIPEPKPRSPRWYSTSVPEEKWDTTEARYSSAEYHTNNLLNPVLFEETSKHIPKNAILIEIAPHGLLQAILKRSMGADCVNVPLTQRGNQHGLEFLLSAVGKLYLAGTIPRVSALYPPVQFPVSRGTPSIAPLVSWDHSATWPLTENKNLENGSIMTRNVSLTLNDECYRILKGVTVNGCNILPAAAVLVLVWKELGNFLSRNFNKMPVVFDSVYFNYIPLFAPKGYLGVIVSFQRATGNFEIFEENKDHIFARGRVRTLKDVAAEYAATTDFDVADGDTWTTHDIYAELETRGFQYGERFRNIREATLGTKGVKALIKRTDDWIVSIDSLLQLALLQSTQSEVHLHMPVFIQKVVIDPFRETADDSTNAKMALFHKFTNTASCGNIEVSGIRTKRVHLESPLNVTLRTISFIPFKKKQFQNLYEFITRAIKLSLESKPSYSKKTITMTVLVNEKTTNGIEAQLKIVFKENKNLKVLLKTLSVPDNQNMNSGSLGNLLFVNDSTVDQGVELLRNHGGFLLACVSSHKEIKWHKDVGVVDEQSFEGRKWILMKKCTAVSSETSVVLVSNINCLKPQEQLVEKAISTNYVVSENNSLDEVKAFVADVSAGKIHVSASCRFVFIVDSSAPPFSPTNSFYSEQLKLDLLVNIYYNGTWGSLVDSPISTAPRSSFSNLIYSLRVKKFDWRVFGVNLQNLKIERMEGDQTCVMDLCGCTVDGQKVMCVAEVRPGSVQATTVPHLTWLVPDYWSMEDAATVPLVYTLAYYSLVLKADARPGENILIQAGHTALGQAFISVALQRGLDVCTTVYNNEHRLYLRKKFPQILDSDIYDLNRNNLEEEVLKKCSKGFRIVVNLLEERYLQMSVNCVSIFGRLLQLCTTEMEQNKDFGMEPFLKNLAFIPIIPEMMFEINSAWRTRLHDMVAEGMKIGVVQPLEREVFTAASECEVVRTLSNLDCMKKMLITKDACYGQHTTNSLRILPRSSSSPSEFSFDSKASCLIIGDAADSCVSLAEWLASRGCCYITMCCNTSALSSLANRRIHILRTQHNMCINIVSVTETYTLEHTLDLIHGISNTAKLAAVFVLFVKDAVSVHNLELSLCNTVSDMPIVVLTNCGIDTVKHMRNSTGLPVLDLQVSSKLRRTKLRFLFKVLDELLLKKPRDTVYLSVEEKGSANILLSSEEQLPTLLPSSVQQLEQLGEDLMLSTSCTLEEVCTKSPRLSHVREVHPVFIIPGLQGPAKISAESLARNLLCPAVVVKLPGGDDNLENNVASIILAMKDLQAEGPYNLVGICWGGIYAIEVARQLQAEGKKTRVFLLEGAPQTNQDIARLLGDGDQLQVNLLVRLLNLTTSTVYKEMLQLPDWSLRLQRALSELPHLSEVSQQHLYLALETVYRRVDTLLQYKPGGVLLSGQGVLIRPNTQTDDSCCLEKFFKKSLKVVLVDTEHRSIQESREVADIISDLLLVDIHWKSHSG